MILVKKQKKITKCLQKLYRKSTSYMPSAFSYNTNYMIIA